MHYESCMSRSLYGFAETTGSLHRALVWATLTTICAADVRGIHDEVKYISKNKTCFPNVGTNINWLTVGMLLNGFMKVSKVLMAEYNGNERFCNDVLNV